jgi:hypothetical protein
MIPAIICYQKYKTLILLGGGGGGVNRSGLSVHWVFYIIFCVSYLIPLFASCFPLIKCSFLVPAKCGTKTVLLLLHEENIVETTWISKEPCNNTLKPAGMMTVCPIP